MNYRCVVVDDEKPARERVKRLLTSHRDFKLVGEAENADGAVELIERETPDVVFLDVQMPEGTGFEVLNRLDALPAVIFTTAYDEYAVQAFEVNSIDYLLKPFSRSRFAEALDRARGVVDGKSGEADLRSLLASLGSEGSAGSRSPLRIPARRGAKIVVVDPEQALWFEAEETLVFVQTTTGRFLVERTLTELETQLAPRFFRAHRQYLVNLSRIQEILPAEAGTYQILVNGGEGEEIPLSRRQARKLRELIPW
ncbi:MAG: LytTR family transcriptional regulator DNA-binding domain-containing protein [Acidobacteriota bacterium]|nr:LytTR family transcriptional regulator DNA-binding domain-containing protein [Acidobacteriota bacterium]MDH3785490.1 LytTR family transcriptional regulator DNA-binding domain-containing protein [Acidobacteriota bacterium]